MKLYPKNDSKQLSMELFRSPTNEYRGVPFWCWNCKLDKAVLPEQIDIFKEMGFGGFHIHARAGLDTPYLGNEFMECVKLSDRKAANEGMSCWLYDEDRFPSGFAGGLVTCDARFRARSLLLTQKQHPEYALSRQEFQQKLENGEKPQGCYLASYQVELENGYVKQYCSVDQNSKSDHGKLWHAYLVIATESPYFNNQTYIDVLNPKAVARFIEVTHERYFAQVGSEFGKSIPAIFTDEPQLSRKWTLPFADSDEDVSIPFTDDLPETYKEQYGISLLDVLPELFWELADGKVSLNRYRYHDHVTDRFNMAYMEQIAQWCEAHNLYATGHFMSERTLFSQTIRLGDAMRLYKSFQLPGIDILCDDKEFSTAKQTVSVARQYGREGVISELYGVTHWYQDFKGHKLQGDWQAALGVTVRVPHLTWMTMAGEGKRDWPASIGYQSPWYKEYAYIEDHFSRLNTVLTRGKSVVRVGVIHPIESYWLMFGPNDQTGGNRDEYDAQFEDMISWLLFGLIDFDFISESLLPELAQEDALAVGKMRYDAIVVPDCKTLRSSTIAYLKRFQAAGGRVLFAGGIPACMDAVHSDIATSFSQQCEHVNFNKSSILCALEPEREVEVRKADGRYSDNLMYQMREDHEIRWLFLCHVNRKNNCVDEPENYAIRLKGQYTLSVYDTLTGETTLYPTILENGFTKCDVVLFPEDSLLLKLEPAKNVTLPVCNPQKLDKVMVLADSVSFKLDEPNVLLMDRAEFAFDQGVWQPEEDILRIDNMFREVLGWPLRGENLVQPWIFPDVETENHVLSLRFTVNTQIVVDNARLALENLDNTEILFNGKSLEQPVANGYYVDKQIKTVSLPTLQLGENEIILRIRLDHKTGAESCYLLGNFGVCVSGKHTMITDMPKTLDFGDVVPQGFPFYAGNIRYCCRFTLSEKIERAVLEIPHFSAPVLAAALDGKKAGLVAFAPHRLELGHLDVGNHELEITSYGNRYNTFGTLHNANDEFKWYGPASFRTTGSQWTDTYLLRANGILDSPLLLCEKSAGR